MTDPLDHTESGAPEREPEQGKAEPRVTPPEIACPVCHRFVPSPAPELCPHCQAPIETILAILRIADLSLEEAMRDLRIGDIDAVERRLSTVRVSSKAHRLRVEAVQAMLDRLKGNPSASLARVRAVREAIAEPDEELLALVMEIEKSALEDQQALAQCCEHYNFALFQARRGHYEEARQAACRALGYVPHHAPTHALLGKIQIALREDDDARYHLERALAVDPSSRSASRALARMSGFRMPNAIVEMFRTRKVSAGWIGSVLIVLALIILALSALLSR
jgi:tetratricopeptide (TPR) repeat protein